jgi:2-methylcitrate dehydratase PrpD
VGVTLGELPPDLLALARCCLLDALMCGIDGRDLPWSRVVGDLTLGRGGRPDASLLGRGGTVPAAAAAWVNGVVIGANELDHGAHQAHPASTVLPAALATAEARGSSGSDLLVALVVGYEVACRVGAAGTRSVEDDRHFHNPSANGPFGAAAATARLLGLDPEVTARALGIAGSASAGLTEYLADGSMTKRLHLGAAARNGLEAAELAAAGMTGPPTVLEGDRGYLAAFADRSAPALLTEGLGERWLTADVHFKHYPCHATLQGLVGVLSEVRHRVRTSEHVRAVALRLGPGERLSQTRFQGRAPATLVEAQYSLPTCVAAALTRDLGRAGGFGPEVLSDPEVRRLAAGTSWTSVSEPGIHGSVELASGETVAFAVATRPEPVTWRRTVDRFESRTDGALRPGTAQRMVALVESIESLPDSGDLLRTLNAGLATP